MSTPEQMPFATTHESGALNLAGLGGQLFVSLCKLGRLNMDTCRSVISGAGLHWESVLLAQTPEQFISRHADALPWLATQIAGYTRGWMDIASETTANLSRCATDSRDVHARQIGTTLDGMARCARGVDAMLRTLNALPVEQDGVPAPMFAESQDIACADPDRAPEAEPGGARRRSISSPRHQ